MPSFAFEKRGKYRVLGFFYLSGNLLFFQKKKNNKNKNQRFCKEGEELSIN